MAKEKKIRDDKNKKEIGKETVRDVPQSAELFPKSGIRELCARP